MNTLKDVDMDAVLDILSPDGFTDDELLTDPETPLTLYMKHHPCEGLSGEARELIDTILNAPAELANLIFNSYGKVSVNTINIALHQKGWSRTKVTRILEEIKKKFYKGIC